MFKSQPEKPVGQFHICFCFGNAANPLDVDNLYKVEHYVDLRLRPLFHAKSVLKVVKKVHFETFQGVSAINRGRTITNLIRVKS